MAGLVAMSPDGYVVATGAGSRVWVARHEAGTDPVDIAELGEDVVGVVSAHGGFAVLTGSGRVVGVDDHARVRWQVALTTPGVAIAGEGPHAAVLSPLGFVRVGPEGERPGGEVDGGRVIAVAADGAVAVGTGRGHVRVFSPRGEGVGASDLGEPDGVNGLAVATSPAGPMWLATAGESLFAVVGDGHRANVVLRTANRAPDHIAVSRDGRVLAIRLGADFVLVLVMPGRETLAKIRYFDRTVTGVALGGPLWLGVGLDQGDNNWISLSDGAVWRSDPPPTEPRRSWRLAPSMSLAALNPTREGPTMVGGGGGGAAAAGVSEEPVDGNNRPATEDAPRPAPQDDGAQQGDAWWARWTGWLGRR